MDWMGADPSPLRGAPFAKSPLWSVVGNLHCDSINLRLALALALAKILPQHSQKRLLNHPIRHRRDAQYSLTTIWFWDRYPASEFIQMAMALDMMLNGQK